MKFRLVLKEKP